MPTFESKKYKCSRCGKEYSGYELPGRGPFPGQPCRECEKEIIQLAVLEQQLLAQDFSIEQEDEKIARQINDLLIKESSGVSKRDERTLTALTERMLKDEKRRKKIIKEILKLQKKKR